MNAEGAKSDLVEPHEEYVRLGRGAVSRQTAYKAIFKAYIDDEQIDEIRQATNGNYVLGDSRFQEEIGTILKRRVTPGLSGRPRQSG